jgi:hypothetical protein
LPYLKRGLETKISNDFKIDMEAASGFEKDAAYQRPENTYDNWHKKATARPVPYLCTVITRSMHDQYTTLFWVDTGYACGGVICRNGQVMDAAPIFRWMIGKPFWKVVDNFRRRGLRSRRGRRLRSGLRYELVDYWLVCKDCTGVGRRTED